MACALDLLGDKWTLLVVRDLLMFEKRLYSELLDSAETIRTNTLAERLRRLEKAGLVTKSAYQRKPVRYAYTLTEAGRALGPVLKAYFDWAKHHVPNGGMPPPEAMKRLAYRKKSG